MAMVSSSALTQYAKQEDLPSAVHEFEGVLDANQRLELHKMRDIPSVDSILTFTAELDLCNRQRKGPSFASRLYLVLLSVRDFCSVVDVFVSSHPEIAALVWGSVRLTMLAITNFASYYEATSDLFLKLGKLCPIFSEYMALFPSSVALQKSLAGFHASIIRCCKHVVQVIRRPWHDQVLRAITSFQQEFKPDLDEIQKHSDHVKQMIVLAKVQTDLEDQRLQAIERKQASSHRSWMTASFSRANNDLSKIQEMQIQSAARKRQKKRQQLLDKLSTHPYRRPLEQGRRKRFGDTASWMFETPEFHRWLDGDTPLLWLSGKIGSGKTIATASIVDHLLRHSEAGGHLVSFFFVKSDNQESLRADTIMRTILRQRLSLNHIPPSVEYELTRMDMDMTCDLEEIIAFLRVVMPPPTTSYVLIDGLDECEKQERDLALYALSKLTLSANNIRLFLSSRPSLREDIRRHFPSVSTIPMDCPSANEDITTYINAIVKQKLTTGELVLGDDRLLKDIKSALISGAQGMFLWVTFQIHDICSKHCDTDIREALDNLPTDLEETFRRALRRVISRKFSQEAQRILPWVTASKRPLSLSELQEAVVIAVGQQYLKRECLWNDMRNIASWCENLIEIDEDNGLVQFAHSSVKVFLLGPPSDSTLSKFHFNAVEADHNIGELCVTYLHFNDFQTAVSQLPQRLIISDPIDIARSAVGSKAKKTTKLLSMVLSKPSTSVDLASLGGFQRDNTQTASETLRVRYPFLEYASVYWVAHTKGFQADISKTWNLWKHIALGRHALAKLPWENDSTDGDSLALQWAFAFHFPHYALLRILISSAPATKIAQKTFLDNPKYIDTTLMAILLETKPPLEYTKELLYATTQAGNAAPVKMLIEAGVPVNIGDGLARTPLQIAALNGHLGVVKVLLSAGAALDNSVYSKRSALQFAAECGYGEVVNELLAAGADVNAAGDSSFKTRTALQLAALGGSLQIVRSLLAYGANINDNTAGWTALRLAVSKGHATVVKELLAAGAAPGDALTEAIMLHDFETVLSILCIHVPSTGALLCATKSGSLPIFNLLIAHGALEYGDPDLRRYFQVAIGCGHMDIVRRLLELGVDVNAPLWNDGDHSALGIAASKGHEQIVQALLDAGANANEAAASSYGRTALQAAAANGHTNIIKMLLRAGAQATDLPGLEIEQAEDLFAEPESLAIEYH